MKFERSKEWWIRQIDMEGEAYIAAGVPPLLKRPPLHLRVFLRLRAKCAYLWRIGVIKRTTAFRWEMDDLLGEWRRRP